MTQPLSEQVALAWAAFSRTVVLPWRVLPALPILNVGDVNAYEASPPRVLTVGPNTSRKGFSEGDLFPRFPLAEARRGRESPFRH